MSSIDCWDDSAVLRPCVGGQYRGDVARTDGSGAHEIEV